MRIIATILAGGNSKRMGSKLPKQFLQINGKAMILHSIVAFDQNKHIHEIILVVPEEYLSYLKKMISKTLLKKIDNIIIGGKERYTSSWAAIQSIHEEENCKVLIHDAARPFITQDIINRVVKNLYVYDAVSPGIPVTDTLFRIDNDQHIVEIPKRKYLYRAQTPQGFSFATIKKAYEIGLKDPNFQATDDCGIIKKYLPKVPIKMISGHVSNKKITFREDIR